MTKKKLTAAPTSPPKFQDKTFLFIFAFVMIWAAIWLVSIYRNIGQPQMEYSEGFVVYMSKLFASGQWSWNINVGPPYMTSFYPPVGYYVFGTIFNLFGGSLLVGRIVVLIMTAGCMLFVFLIVKHFTKSNPIAFIAALLPITHNVMQEWTFLIRLDLLAVLFELGGLYLIIRLAKSRWIFLSIILFLLAFYTKQSMVAGALAAAVYLFIQNRRQGLIFAGIFGGSLLGIFAVANATTDGAFFRELVLHQQTIPAYRPIGSILWVTFVVFLVFLPVLIMGISYVVKNIKSLFALFALASLALNIFSLTHPGGNVNYFFESIFALSIAAGLFIPDILKSNKKIFYILPFLVSLVMITQSFGIYPDNEYKIRYQEAEAVIADAAYPVLTENAGIVIDAGKVPYYEPFVFSNLAKLGYWDGNIVINDLKTNRIEYVITQYELPYADVQRFTPDVQSVIVENYHIVLNYSEYKYGFVVYKANNKSGGK